MKKALALLLVLLSLPLSACHSHDWEDADCETPKTCLDCGETKGEALGHDWEKATCIKPKTCSECGETKGEALGHTWKDATCYAPKTCANCGLKEGSALGHKWKEATCSSPMTCSACGKESGDIADHSWKEATCTNPKSCTYCGLTEGAALAHTWKDATCLTPKTCSICGTREGTALGHSWEAVNVYTQKCKTCGTSEVDQSKQPVSLGNLTPCTGKNYYVKNKSIKDIYGNEFAEGLYLNLSSGSTQSTEYVLNKTYKTFTTTALISSGSDDTFKGRLKIYVDDILVFDSQTITKKTVPIIIEIDVANATFIKFEATDFGSIYNYSDDGYLMLATPTLSH